MTILKKLFLGTSLFFMAIASAFASKGPTYVDGDGFAIKGYDPVAYFTENKPVEGSEEFKYEWNHGIWLFANQANLDSFKVQPEKYAPQYGGYCAFAAAKNSLAKIDPTQFTVLNDKLYLNYNSRIQKKWTKKRDDFIAAGDKNWPELLAEAKENIAK
jgi:YHS domain-containing protein